MNVTKAQNLGEEYSLVSDSQERQAVLEHIGRPDLMDEYGSLFVLVGEAEYVEVWGVWNCVVYNNSDAYQIY